MPSFSPWPNIMCGWTKDPLSLSLLPALWATFDIQSSQTLARMRITQRASKTQITGLQAWGFWFRARWVHIICISNKFPNNTYVLVWGYTLRNTRFHQCCHTLSDISFFSKTEKYSILCRHSIFFIHYPLMDILFASLFWMLWLGLPWTREFSYLFKVII